MARQIEMVIANRFEAAGLGIGPYRFLRTTESVFNNGDGTTKPGSSCDYCGTAIRNVFWIQSSDDKEIKVGCECVRHTGDKGLVERATREQRDMDTAKRHAREDKKIQAGKELIEANHEKLAALPHPRKYFADQGQTLADYVGWYMSNAGNKGKLETISYVEKIINQ